MGIAYPVSGAIGLDPQIFDNGLCITVIALEQSDDPTQLHVAVQSMVKE